MIKSENFERVSYIFYVSHSFQNLLKTFLNIQIYTSQLQCTSPPLQQIFSKIKLKHTL